MRTQLHTTVSDLSIGFSYAGPTINHSDTFTQNNKISMVVSSGRIMSGYILNEKDWLNFSS